MRLAFVALLLALGVDVAVAQCPPACSGGGGPAASDCFLAFGGVSGKVVCTDGDPACDVDGAIDGACTFGVAACTNAAVGACAATPLDAAPTGVEKGTGAEAFLAALAGLSPAAPACTDPGLVRLTIATSQVKLKPAKVIIRTTAIAGGKKDKDTLRLVCNPARPGLASSVRPIFTANCTYAGCHSGIVPERNLNLQDGQALASLVNQKALGSRKLSRVKPGSVKKSYLTNGLFGVGARQMPDTCPDPRPPVERCLTDVETYTILAWIQAGALP